MVSFNYWTRRYSIQWSVFTVYTPLILTDITDMEPLVDCITDRTLNLAIVIPESYPAQPPKINFSDKVFHPNVNYAVRDLLCDSSAM